MHRVNHWELALIEHLENREWSQSQIEAMSRDIGHSALMSHEGVLRVLETQQQIDEQIQAEKRYDELFVCPQIERTEIAQQEFNRNIVDL